MRGLGGLGHERLGLQPANGADGVRMVDDLASFRLAEIAHSVRLGHKRPTGAMALGSALFGLAVRRSGA